MVLLWGVVLLSEGASLVLCVLECVVCDAQFIVVEQAAGEDKPAILLSGRRLGSPCENPKSERRVTQS